MPNFRNISAGLLSLLLLAGFLAGCATSSVHHWKSQVGKISYDEAVEDLGKPFSVETETDGTVTAEWVLRPGRPEMHSLSAYPESGNSTYTPAQPSRALRLTFAPDHKLRTVESFLQ